MYKLFLICFLLLTLQIKANSMTTPNDTTVFTYLALGDSYTIGEGVGENDRFPVQTVKILKNSGIEVADPKIVAKTGWTTIELNDALNANPINETYDIVTLLIGVNDQYRGFPVESYKPWFTQLLERAIGYAGGKANHVVVISIPDWGVTPYAEGRDRDDIAGQIDQYNEANKAIAKKHKVKYLDITPDTRDVMQDPKGLITSDGLHYSGQEMGMWAAKLSIIFKAIVAPPPAY
ncbi:SGNH/GDSL hydrolase family protein [Chitinophaga sancti]|uniref:SGNH/GDSL hydrolase family protein n=1 Tax=Chitinophaga sancti TaxID=1004 RepID=UPI002A75133A|nr:SGNH/GDSL hydrolase family protein [Chitinophaga sancti]WPQ62482.1 SGNH/GDSL hydrolase family protein [Chitinophaga sancti]